MTDSTPARMIAFIQQLYDIERGAAELTPEVRQEHAVPLLAQIDAERARLTSIVLPKSREGVRYLTNQWVALQRYVEDGRLAIDNNRAENQLRIVALGRKNWLFAGSFEGARRAPVLARPKLQTDRHLAIRVKTSCCAWPRTRSGSSISSRREAGPRPSARAPPPDSAAQPCSASRRAVKTWFVERLR